MLNALYLEFVNRVNEVGVDVNRCVMFPHTMPLIQFVCGLGPRKGFHLIKVYYCSLHAGRPFDIVLEDTWRMLFMIFYNFFADPKAAESLFGESYTACDGV